MIPLNELKEAMEKDFEQHMINSITPDRGYPFPVDNVRVVIDKCISELEKENAELRSLVAEARDGYAEILEMTGSAIKTINLIKGMPDDAA